MFHKGIHKYLHLYALIYIKFSFKLSCLNDIKAFIKKQNNKQTNKQKNYLWKADPITINIDMFTESINHICFFKAFLKISLYRSRLIDFELNHILKL